MITFTVINCSKVMFCHKNKAFLFCLPKRCSWSRSRLNKGSFGQQKNRHRLHPKSGGSGSATLITIKTYVRHKCTSSSRFLTEAVLTTFFSKILWNTSISFRDCFMSFGVKLEDQDWTTGGINYIKCVKQSLCHNGPQPRGLE